MSRQPSVRALLGRAAATLRSEGPEALIRRSIPVIKRRRDRLCRRALARAGVFPPGERIPGRGGRSDPTRSPMLTPSFDCGSIRRGSTVRTGARRTGGGDWDRTMIPVTETVAYSSVEAHFRRGVP
ncbi:hypothetical protein [Haloterrigena turkmenica]|uniref:hypothetical protein n=1 Tax=Haloterrigena turkmenica TaxID=62320 RepID=UPI001CF78F87|nr:hypothetical protein [Haloterrigena turkmenica]